MIHNISPISNVQPQIAVANGNPQTQQIDHFDLLSEKSFDQAIRL